MPPDEPDAAAVPPSPAGTSPAPRRTERPAAADQYVLPRGFDGPVVNVLPLGAGLLLTGLGLAFLALRLRR
ncbi:hypothetical protein J3486_20060 [Streptomyces sp. VRA16 Mangrove soil]|nr:hypothetical protein [Streptomyces sp. VRA16 Mangrove soil]